MRLRGCPEVISRAFSFSMLSLRMLCSQLRVKRQTLVLTFRLPKDPLRRYRRDLPSPFSTMVRNSVQSAQWDELCGGPTLSTVQDQDSLSPEASSQLISGSQVGIQVTPVSGAVTPQWPAPYWTFCLQPYFQLIHFLICHVLLSPGSSRLIGKYLVYEGIVMIL